MPKEDGLTGVCIDGFVLSVLTGVKCWRRGIQGSRNIVRLVAFSCKSCKLLIWSMRLRGLSALVPEKHGKLG